MHAVSLFAESAWNGDSLTHLIHPLASFVGFEEFRPGLGFLCAFSNALAVDTREGVLLIDTSSILCAGTLFESVRRLSPRPLHTAVYTHGHVDHVFGLGPFEEEAQRTGQRIRVIAHEACPRRFDRYQLTPGYNGLINARQFGLPQPIFPTHFRYPDETIGTSRRLVLGDVTVELFHDRGETDDHLWAYLPEARALYTGDLFIWASPNCGNPQKAQRYPREWAQALRKMERLDVELLFPGHGPPIVGAARVKQALGDTAALLESLTEQTLALLNQGATLDEILHSVKPPEALMSRPYLRPSYDDPQFIVRNIVRLYGGWYDGNPAHLKPAPEAALARELAMLCGGVDTLCRRAEVLLSEGQLALAGHLCQLALSAAAPVTPLAQESQGDDEAYQRVRATYTTVYERRAEVENSLMAKAIFTDAARRQRS